MTADGVLWVRGADFKASADSDGFSFIPFLGSQAPRNFPVAFVLAGATRDGSALTLAPSAEVQRVGSRFVLDRGDVQVRYDIALDAVEQSFALEIPAGEGDLVLTLAVETDLACAPLGAGLEFRDTLGGMTYGAAVVIDALGRRSPVSVTWTGVGIDLIVPGTFLNVATGPIVIDPILATITIDDYSAELRYPDMAYDAAGDQYCIVYEEIFSGGDIDVYSYFVDAPTGSTSDGAYFDQTADSWRRPRIAAQQNDRVFLVVATSDGAVAGSDDIVARIRSAADGSLLPAFILKGHGASYECRGADVGGDNFMSSSSFFCVVYNRDYGTDNDVVAIMVDVNGNWTATGEIFLATTLVGDELRPAVSKSTGSTSGSTVFNLAWEYRDTTTGEGKVAGCQLSYDGSTIYGPFDVTPLTNTTTYFGVEVSCLSDVNDGLGQAWLVAYDDGATTLEDTFVAHCAGQTVLSIVQLTRSEHADIVPNQDYMVIGTFAEYFALAYQEGGEQFLTIVQPVGTGLGITERRLPVVATAPLLDSLTIATTFEGGGTFGDGFLAWSDHDGSDLDILAAYFWPDFNLTAAGYQYCYGAANSTGDRGFIQVMGDRMTTSTQTLEISGLPSAFGFCLASLSAGNVPGAGGSQGTLCLSSDIGRFGIYSTSGAGGTASIPVNPFAIQQPTGTVSALSGQTWRFQSWHRDSVGGVATSNFTNAVALPFL